MRRFAFALLTAFALVSLGSLTSPAKAGDYYGGGYYQHRYYDAGYYRRHHYDDYHRRVWYSSSCCYRKVVRHVRTVHYERVHRYGYYGRPYYRYGYYSRPYHRHYDGYYYRPYRPYLGYDKVGYAGCGPVPLADGRGGWVWSRRAGCHW